MSLARLREVSNDVIMPSLNPFVGQITAIAEVEQVILFGSLSKGEMTEASDIDLAILLEEKANVRELKERLRQLKKLHLSWPCDLVVVKLSWFESRRLFGGICMEIANNGRILYKKSPTGEH
jgi:predicted nucleotidyltransferase